MRALPRFTSSHAFGEVSEAFKVRVQKLIEYQSISQSAVSSGHAPETLDSITSLFCFPLVLSEVGHQLKEFSFFSLET